MLPLPSGLTKYGMYRKANYLNLNVTEKTSKRELYTALCDHALCFRDVEDEDAAIVRNNRTYNFSFYWSYDTAKDRFGLNKYTTIIKVPKKIVFFDEHIMPSGSCMDMDVYILHKSQNEAMIDGLFRTKTARTKYMNLHYKLSERFGIYEIATFTPVFMKQDEDDDEEDEEDEEDENDTVLPRAVPPPLLRARRQPPPLLRARRQPPPLLRPARRQPPPLLRPARSRLIEIPPPPKSRDAADFQDDKKEEVLSSLPDEPSCPICFERYTAVSSGQKPHIWQCADGHSLCHTCAFHLKTKICPMCRKAIIGRNIAFEEVGFALATVFARTQQK